MYMSRTAGATENERVSERTGGRDEARLTRSLDDGGRGSLCVLLVCGRCHAERRVVWGRRDQRARLGDFRKLAQTSSDQELATTGTRADDGDDSVHSRMDNCTANEMPLLYLRRGLLTPGTLPPPCLSTLATDRRRASGPIPPSHLSSSSSEATSNNSSNWRRYSKACLPSSVSLRRPFQREQLTCRTLKA